MEYISSQKFGAVWDKFSLNLMQLKIGIRMTPYKYSIRGELSKQHQHKKEQYSMLFFKFFLKSKCKLNAHFWLCGHKQKMNQKSLDFENLIEMIFKQKI